MEIKIEKPICYMLVGLPGCGKTTWRNKTIGVLSSIHGLFQVVSSDEWIEAYAHKTFRTYDDVFKEYVPTASQLMHRQLEEAISNKWNILWDQTNLTEKAWKFKLDRVKKAGYETVAILFLTDPALCVERQKLRPGKNIPNNVFMQMVENYKPLANGTKNLLDYFDKVVYINE